MPGFGGFYKGEKKKPKKGQEGKGGQPPMDQSAFVMPELVKKKKENSW